VSSKYEIFDRSQLKVQSLADRVHDLHLDNWLGLEETAGDYDHPDLGSLADRIVTAREKGAAVILLMGAHVIRAGVNRQIIDLMKRGCITHIGMNGAGPIHDFELARIGATTESVAKYISSGEFGLWHETGELNDIIHAGANEGLGLGESIGRQIDKSDYPHKELSVLGNAYGLGVPVTVHVGVGYDIIHEHPNCDGAALGEASYRDFLILCKSVQNLEGGVMLCYGSAVMGPEVYLKALSMSRNVAHQRGDKICDFTTAAFDLIEIKGDYHQQADKSNPQYYYRPWKTLLVRTVADGGESFYLAGDHRLTLPALRKQIIQRST
jgi:hypothetical protein